MSEDRDAFLTRMRYGAFQPGEQRAYIMSRVLDEVDVIFAGVHDPIPLRSMGFLTATTIDEAWDMAGDIAGRPATALVVPHALLTMPVVATPAGIGVAAHD
jgi:hypothetical protein